MRFVAILIVALHSLPYSVQNLSSSETAVILGRDSVILGRDPRTHLPVTSKENRAASIIESTRQALRAMDELRSYIGKEAIRAEIIDALLEDPGMVPLASKILVDNAFARNSYGADQAIARVYAIELLARKADLSDSTPLFTTTSELAAVLNAKDEITKGEFRDLEDLLYESISRHDLSKVHSDLNALLQQFNYTTKLAQPFHDALAFALRGKMSDSDIMVILQAHFVIAD